MVVGLFRDSGAYLGEQSYESRPANPFGFYEDREINALNNEILKELIHWRMLHGLPSVVRPGMYRTPASLWLHVPKRLHKIQVRKQTVEAMCEHFRRQPFCLKDPRFSTTLPWWRAHLPAETRFIVLFRDADRTVDSMLREATERYSPPLALTPNWAYRVWLRTYERILHELSQEGEWLFVNFDQVLNQEAIPAIECFSEVALNTSQISPHVSRAGSTPATDGRWRHRCQWIYDELTKRSEATVNKWSR